MHFLLGSLLSIVKLLFVVIFGVIFCQCNLFLFAAIIQNTLVAKAGCKLFKFMPHFVNHSKSK